MALAKSFVPEPDVILFARQDGERVTRRSIDDRELDRIRPYVNSG